jgi:hypothetical protein
MVGGTVHSGLNTMDCMLAEKTGVAYFNRPTTILPEWNDLPVLHHVEHVLRHVVLNVDIAEILPASTAIVPC